MPLSWSPVWSQTGGAGSGPGLDTGSLFDKGRAQATKPSLLLRQVKVASHVQDSPGDTGPGQGVWGWTELLWT